MISASDIERIMSNHEDWHHDKFSIYFYGTYALAKKYHNPSNNRTHIPGGHIVDISYDDAIKLPGFQSYTIRYPGPKFVDYKEPLTKKWAAEQRVSEYIVYNERDTRVEIYDDYVVASRGIIVTNNEIYSMNFGSYRRKHQTLFGTNILLYTDSYIYDKPHDIPKGMCIETVIKPSDLYQKVVKCRSRGFIKRSAHLSDIIVINDH